MDNNLTLIAQYLYQHGHSDVAQTVLDFPEFNATHRRYLDLKHHVTEYVNSTDRKLLSSDAVDYIYGHLHQLDETTDTSEMKLKIRISLVTITYLEQLLIEKNTEEAVLTLKLLPEETDLSTRQNLSSLLISSDTPNVFLSAINWRNVSKYEQSRALLVENLFRLLPSSIYLYPHGLESIIRDAGNYQNLSHPSFGTGSDLCNMLGNGDSDDSAQLPTKIKQTLNYHTDEVWFIKYSPNGRYLATGSKDKKIMVYDATENYKLTAVFKLHTESITYLAWNSSSTEILSLSFDQVLRVWSVATGKCIRELDKSQITQSRLSAAKFSPDYETNNQIIVASNDGRLFTVSISEDRNVPPKLVCEYSKTFVSPQIQDFTIQNNFIWAITVMNELIVFSLDTLKLIYKIQLNQPPVAITSVSASFPGVINQDGTTNSYVLINLKPSSLVLVNTSGITSSSGGSTVTHLDLGSTKSRPRTRSRSTSSSFSAIKRPIVTPEQEMVNTNGRLPYLESFFHLPTASANNYVMRGCAGGNFNPSTSSTKASSGIVLSGGRGGEIWMWGYEGNILHCVRGHEGLVNCVDWRGDKWYEDSMGNVEWASGSDDGKVIVWGV